MLMDVLGIVLAFSSIMLIFSLLVTTLVQSAEATFNLRYRNLKTGILAIGEELTKLQNNSVNIEKSSLYKKMDEKLSYRSFMFFGIKKTVVSYEDVVKIFDEYLKADGKYDSSVINGVKDKVGEIFTESENYMRLRFQRIMHVLSIFIALVVAFVFQLNSFSLLQQLSVDQKLRDEYIEIVGKKDLNKIATKNAGAINKNVVAKELTKKTERELEAEVGLANKDLEVVKNSLVLYDFTIMPNGLSYYYKVEGGCLIELLNRWLGVFFSGILISLGAPFWFNSIKKVTSLKDKLSKD